MSAALVVGLGSKLRQLITRLDGDVQQLYGEMRVSFRPRFYPVVRLLLRESQNVNSITAQVGVSQPAITQTLSEMKKVGLITTKPGRDRRNQIIRLTSKGQSLAERLQPVWSATDRAAAGLDADLTARLSAIVDEALAALDKKPFRDRIRAELSKES
jgi:DNA-binding MarR family transcriptional regulator